jgi:hypothetical protein
MDINREGMGRRATLNGTELDDLLHAGRDTVDNHRNHSRAKVRRNRRVRRQVRAGLRNGQEA